MLNVLVMVVFTTKTEGQNGAPYGNEHHRAPLLAASARNTAAISSPSLVLVPISVVRALVLIERCRTCGTGYLGTDL